MCKRKLRRVQDAKPPQLKCASSKDLVTIYQFEVTKTPYKKVDQNGKVIESISTKTEKVPKKLSYEELYNKIVNIKSCI